MKAMSPMAVTVQDWPSSSTVAGMVKEPEKVAYESSYMMTAVWGASPGMATTAFSPTVRVTGSVDTEPSRFPATQ